METQATFENPVAGAALDEEAKALRLAIDHARRGNAVAARILLVDICSRNPNNELAWLWRASLATTAEEGLSYMDQVLRLNPQNRTALGWLAKMGRPAPAPAAPSAATPAAATPAGGPQTAVPASPSAPAASAPGSPAPSSPASGLATLAAHVESAPARATPQTAVPPIPARVTEVCPVCEGEVEPRTAKCPHCRAVLVMVNPIDFALSRPVDLAVTTAALERWEPRAAAGSVEADLALATIHLNRLDYAQASQFLKRALEKGLPVPAPALFADGVLMKTLTYPVVMVVDDSATIRDVVVRTLGPHEILPLPVGNPWDVMDMLQAQKPALVLLDVTMPGVDGIELCKKIRANKATRATPVIMLTGHDALIDKLMGKMAGATEYLTKPFKPEALLKTVRKHLEKRRG